MGSISDGIKKLCNFPDDQKKNPFYLLNLKKSANGNGLILNENSPSDLMLWYEDKPEKWSIIESHGFELLEILENENVTLREAAIMLIDHYEKYNPVKFSDMSEEDQKESVDSMDDRDMMKDISGLVGKHDDSEPEEDNFVDSMRHTIKFYEDE
jgi:hypothetical protein